MSSVLLCIRFCCAVQCCCVFHLTLKRKLTLSGGCITQHVDVSRKSVNWLQTKLDAAVLDLKTKTSLLGLKAREAPGEVESGVSVWSEACDSVLCVFVAFFQTAVEVFRRMILEAEKMDGGVQPGKTSCSVM